jgi:hypothetical protein
LYEKHEYDNENYRLAKFKNEFEDYFDKDFSLFYYCLTLVLLMMDSRAKNMMLASWDQKKWYPIFYDMDTMLGVNNTGFNKFSFDTEDLEEDRVFNGYDSVLWNNFKAVFYNDIANFYSDMRGSKGLNLENLLKFYNEKSADSWNEALITADADYKYVRPFSVAYIDGSNEDNPNMVVTPGSKNYLYAAQGKRSNHRAWWLSNRLNYLDSKFKAETLGDNKPSESNTFSFRAYSLPEQKSNEEALACVEQTPPSQEFELTALNNSYQSIMLGTIVYGPKYTLGGQKVILGTKETRHEVESWILNPSLISDLGDLSNKYIGSWTFPNDPVSLTELNFGRSSRSHPNSYDKYYNKLLISLNIGSSCPLLKKINIARCTGLAEIDVSKCSRLEIFDAEKSKLKSIYFPSNSILKQLYLPNSLESLVLLE